MGSRNTQQKYHYKREKAKIISDDTFVFYGLRRSRRSKTVSDKKKMLLLPLDIVGLVSSRTSERRVLQPKTDAKPSRGATFGGGGYSFVACLKSLDC